MTAQFLCLCANSVPNFTGTQNVALPVAPSHTLDVALQQAYSWRLNSAPRTQHVADIVDRLKNVMQCRYTIELDMAVRSSVTVAVRVLEICKDPTRG